jgi:general secretion pathway protein C
MKQIISSKHLSTLIFILSIIVTVKLLWLVISILFLPNIGEEFQESSKAKKLYYRVRLTNESKVIAAIQPTKALSSKVSSMRGYKLLGLYNSEKTLVVTIEKGRKTEILSKGETTTNGFKLVSAGSNFVIFKKNSEEFKLTLENTKNSKSTKSSNSLVHKAPQIKSNTSSEIEEVGGVKHIPKTLLTSYTKDMDKIWKDIGLAQYKKNGKADGFKVNFLKRGSDIEKLGLKRGDILKAINAEPLNLSSAMGFFNGINDLENLTLTVERNGKSEDLEYEIQ